MGSGTGVVDIIDERVVLESSSKKSSSRHESRELVSDVVEEVGVGVGSSVGSSDSVDDRHVSVGESVVDSYSSKGVAVITELGGREPCEGEMRGADGDGSLDGSSDGVACEGLMCTVVLILDCPGRPVALIFTTGTKVTTTVGDCRGVWVWLGCASSSLLSSSSPLSSSPLSPSSPSVVSGIRAAGSTISTTG